MPKYIPEYEEEIKIAIRDFIILDPSVSIPRLGKYLKEKKGFETYKGNELDEKYLTKLLKKVRKEQIDRVDKTKLIGRVSELKERYRLTYEKLIKIAFYTKEMMEAGMFPPSYKDQIDALKTINKMDLEIFQAEMDAGIFERHLGILEGELKVSEEKRVLIMAAFKNFNFFTKQNDGGETETKREIPAITDRATTDRDFGQKGNASGSSKGK